MLTEQCSLLEAAFPSFVVSDGAKKQIMRAYCEDIFSLRTCGIRKHLCI